MTHISNSGFFEQAEHTQKSLQVPAGASSNCAVQERKMRNDIFEVFGDTL